jgi:hypothetical protein
MKILKFVSQDYRSVGRYNEIDYTPGRRVIEVKNYDPDSREQCSRGIHGFIYDPAEKTDWAYIIFYFHLIGHLIELEVEEKDIIYPRPLRKNCKVRCRRVANPRDAQGEYVFAGHYKTGQPMWEYTYKDGQLTEISAYHENGQLRYKERHEGGQLVSTINWYEFGQLEHEEIYENGQRVNITGWHENGRKVWEKRYEEGK